MPVYRKGASRSLEAPSDVVPRREALGRRFVIPLDDRLEAGVQSFRGITGAFPAFQPAGENVRPEALAFKELRHSLGERVAGARAVGYDVPIPGKPSIQGIQIEQRVVQVSGNMLPIGEKGSIAPRVHQVKLAFRELFVYLLRFHLPHSHPSPLTALPCSRAVAVTWAHPLIYTQLSAFTMPELMVKVQRRPILGAGGIHGE